ncbi:variant erythrocyte surface antigen-1 family protein [Babesia caballi]|uniref:Variant erythrocyte surface antigen-1 family protein n=1 Tax=Babesia caballi TaxID=5871 RepID=A0AAV4LZM4_BABCB|nr:variant erythrocyte surface antigen-1 family protein [Babesia caballi]
MEAIYWILRVTGKDGGQGGDGGTEGLSNAVNSLISKAGVAQIKPAITIEKTLIENLADGLAKFIGYSGSSIGTDGIAVGRDGGMGPPYGPEYKNTGKGYKLTYDRAQATWQNQVAGGGDAATKKNICAKIFLGCVPLYYYWLTYLYWKCAKGGWAGQNFTHPTLQSYMAGHGYVADHLNSNKKASEMIKTAFSGFRELTTAVTTTTATQHSHPDLLNELNKNLQRAISSSGSSTSASFNNHSLSALFYVCRYYFTGKHIMQSKRDTTSKHRPPTSIREMLYWLSGLHFSPRYSDLEKQIDAFIPQDHGLPVADSGTSNPNNFLTRSQMNGFLLSSCLSAPGVLGAIQGNSANTDGEPWLHSLFSNNMNLQYPAGSALFNTLANYTYALQFQLLFLYQQCSNNGMKCGWQDCTYGKAIKGLGHSLQSHICPGFKCQNSNCTHNGTNGCNHNNYSDDAGCGKSDKTPSPLQAFITGTLPSFGLSPSSTTNHMSDHPQGALCHVPMGFHSNNLRQTNGTGNYILSALRPICGDVFSPFRQLCEKLGCLTKRTPRTLGDLFGFYWQLTGQMFNTISLKSKLQAGLASNSDNTRQSIMQFFGFTSAPKIDSLLSKSLNTLESGFTFWGTLDGYFAVSDIAVGLYGLNQHCHHQAPQASSSGLPQLYKHTSNCTGANDLQSLLNAIKNDNRTKHEDCLKGSCGPYLSPLTHSAGATYAPVHASVYLSWLAYLTDDFHEWFQNLLDEFKNIDCSKMGCRAKASGSQQACTSHAPGTHGTNTECKCDSVVHCGGVLPVLYRHGFTFYSPYTLSGGNNGTTKRSCDKFHDALSNVLAEGAPLTKLLETIDEFLYLFRFYFLYNQSAFWTIYVCIILYTFFFLLDTLRVRSHLHIPSSNSIAPISLLGTGKAPTLTKFTKLLYFIS